VQRSAQFVLAFDPVAGQREEAQQQSIHPFHQDLRAHRILKPTGRGGGSDHVVHQFFAETDDRIRTPHHAAGAAALFRGEHRPQQRAPGDGLDGHDETLHHLVRGIVVIAQPAANLSVQGFHLAFHGSDEQFVATRKVAVNGGARDPCRRGHPLHPGTGETAIKITATGGAEDGVDRIGLVVRHGQTSPRERHETLGHFQRNVLHGKVCRGCRARRRRQHNRERQPLHRRARRSARTRQRHPDLARGRGGREI